MTFGWPAALWGLALLPLGALAYRAAAKRGARYAVTFPNVEVLASVAPRPRRRWVAGLLLTLAAAALLVGLARPRATILVPREDASVVLVMDVSGSMQADDVEPTRIEAAKVAARTFLRQVPERFRIGLVTFSSAADVMAPPTADRTRILRSIASLQPMGGTAMGDGLARAVRVLQQDSRTDREQRLSAVLLLSDGANTSGSSPIDAASLARSANVPVYTVALGSLEPSLDELLRNVTPPDVETLQAIAETTRARSFSAPTTEDLERIYRDLGSRMGFRPERREVTAAFAGAGAVLLAAGAFAALRRRPALP